MTQLRILDLVYQDVSKAADWYDSKEEFLGNRFIACFRAAYSPILANPRSFPCVHGEYRRVLLDPFPYALYFRLEDDFAIVTLVFHTSRKPATSKRVLRKRGKSP
jgi:plasmid stabilization system protein ParE